MNRSHRMGRKILIVSPYYYPGSNAGGPIKSLQNLSRLLLQHYPVRVVTKDRDVGAAEAFSQIEWNRWNETPYGRVYYSSSLFDTARRLYAECSGKHCVAPLVHLNSVFSFRFSVLFLALRWAKLISTEAPVIVAPRGEFAPGALQIKPVRKRGFLIIAKALGFYRGVTWHATNPQEATYIKNIFGAAAEVRIASNLTSGGANRSGQGLCKRQGEISIACLARLARVKNLHFAIEVLASVKAKVQFDLYGPLEDREYWAECEQIIGKLPSNISVHWRGPLENAQVQTVLSSYHLFFLPTLGENFGHAIVEAMQAGCPVLISNMTPWLDLERAGVGRDLPLDRPDAFVAAIEAMAVMNESELEVMRARVLAYVASHVESPETIEQSLTMFSACLSSRVK